MRLFFGCFLLMLCTACHTSSAVKESTVSIRLSKDSQTVVITGLEHSIVEELRKDTLPNVTSLLQVYRMPKDTEMLDFQNQLYGAYRTVEDTIVFKPDTPFVKHQLYIARFYGSSGNYSPANLIRGKSNLRGMPFTEVRFKF